MDHIADSNRVTLYYLANKLSFPDFVKSACVGADTTSLPNNAFADSVNRRFPCHTKADTYLSYVYFAKNANKLSAKERVSVGNELNKWAEYWNIAGEAKSAADKLNKNVGLDDFSDNDFAIVQTFKGKTYRALPIVNDACVKAAEDHLERYKERYPLAWRVEAAKRISKKADELASITKSKYISKVASAHAAQTEKIAGGMYDRVLMVKDRTRLDDTIVAFTKLAAAVANKAEVTLGYATKLASIIDQFDRQYKLTRLYSRGLPSPEELVYDDTIVKTARAIKNSLVKLANGSVYSKKALVSCGLKPYTVLDESFVSGFSAGNAIDNNKLAAALPTLAKTAADLLDKALAEVGVIPVNIVAKRAGLKAGIKNWTKEDWNRVLQLC